MSYKQLTLEKRYDIRAYLQAGFSKVKIAELIGVHKTTIYRELKRNMGLIHYRPLHAQMRADSRRRNARKKKRFTDPVKRCVETLLKQDLSPEQISGYLAKEHEISISHETIYKHICADKQQGGLLYTHLRHNCHKRRRRYRAYENRGMIPGRISIDERPEIVDSKERIGDWEIDTMYGKHRKGALITAVERKTKYTRLCHVASVKSEEVTTKIIQMLRPIKSKVLTITVDNGKEFSFHKKIAEALNADVYFAHPYHAWERGLNENTNGLIRQYFPKKTSFLTIDRDQTRFAQNRLNRRPRKLLGYNTPLDCFLNIKVAVGT